VKFSFSWRVFLVLLPLGLTSAFGQADLRLVCDSISASKSKCGYTNPCAVDSKKWLTRVGETIRSATYDPVFLDGSENGYFVQVSTYNPSNCSSSAGPCSGFGHIHIGGEVAPGDCDYSICLAFCDIPGRGNTQLGRGITAPGFDTPGCSIGDWYCSAASSSVSCSSTVREVVVTIAHPACNPNCARTTGTWTNRLTFSNEYTTEILISTAQGALPAYDGDYNDACSASRDLSVDESSLTIQRFKYKFTFPSAAQPFVIYWVERFTPAGSGSPSDTSRCEPISISTTESSVHELLEPSSNGTITIEDVYVETFDANTATVASGASPSISLDQVGVEKCPYGAYGLTWPESVDITISSCSDGVNWHAVLTGLKGNYSKQFRLYTPLPNNQQEVTGIGGNTTPQNFCAQVTELTALGYCGGYWYMLQAVIDHESVHEGHFLPTLKTVAPPIQAEVQGIIVPDSGQSEGDAVAEIEASPEFEAAKMHARNLWLEQILPLGDVDHHGATAAKEHAVVDPMISWICTYANSNNWGACTVCSTPTPPAPTANGAANVTGSGFTANWSSVSGATGYLLDVSTSSSFTSYLSGYQNLDVGNTISRSVTGLSANTTYYYRVRAYNSAGTSGNSNVVTVTTLPNPPSAPTANAATNVTSSGFTANWSSISGASGYRLDVSTNRSFTSYVSGYQNLDVGNVTRWSVTGLSVNTAYYYRVCAYNTGGVSSTSNVIHVKTKPH
jgi:hypothetical protein